MNTKKQVKFHF